MFTSCALSRQPAAAPAPPEEGMHMQRLSFVCIIYSKYYFPLGAGGGGAAGRRARRAAAPVQPPPDFIQAHITGFDIWRDLRFWEEYFWGK